MVQQFLCFTSLPDINQLLYTFATIDQQEAAKTSQYNLTILKCRQLLFENSYVLACPNLEGLFGIYVVAKKSYFKDGSLHEYFKKRNLKPGQTNYLFKHIYEECCYYTITAKLAPKWNLISNYLVRGREFLTATNAIDAMHLTININNAGDTSFGFQISRIKLPGMTLDKLDIHKSKMAELFRKKFVELKKYESKTIRVLPSLKRAKIVSISRTIRENGAIKNYHDMKRHWKNTYGYRLPESDDGLFYVAVSFFEGSLVFTYPSVCVRPYEPVFMQRVDPAPVVAVFMADLLKTVPTILGDTYKVPSHVSVPNHELAVVSQPSSYPNATAVEDRPEPKYRHNVSATQNSAFAFLPTQKPIPQTSNNEQRSKLTQLVTELEKPEHKMSKYVTQKTSSSPQMSQTQTQQHNLEIESNKTTIATFIDNIIQQKYNNKPSSTYKNINSENINSNYTPILGKPKITQNAENTNKNSAVRQELKSQIDFLNNCVAQRSKIGPMLPTSEQNIITDKYIPKFTSKNTTNITKQKDNTPCKMNSIEKSTSRAETPTSFKQKLQSVPKKVPLKSTVNGTSYEKSKVENKSTMAETPAGKRDRKQPAFIVSQMKEITKYTQNVKTVPDNVVPMKRKNDNDSPSVKKLKVKATELTNMEDHIKNKTLDKLTVPTLVHWLHENSVRCNLKERKSELILKVFKFYQNN